MNLTYTATGTATGFADRTKARAAGQGWPACGFGMAAVVAATFGATPALADSLIKVDGSSTVFPITEAAAEEFQAAKKGAVNVTVGISGTGGGFKMFCRG